MATISRSKVVNEHINNLNSAWGSRFCGLWNELKEKPRPPKRQWNINFKAARSRMRIQIIDTDTDADADADASWGMQDAKYRMQDTK